MAPFARTVPWGPDDWDAWTLEPGSEPAGPGDEVATVRSTLGKIPHRARKTVADLGCGRGGLLPFLSSQFSSVVALDYAPATIALARRECQARNITFRRRDLRDLTPFRNRFHVAVAVDSIVGPGPADVDRILGQVRKSLVEGGILLATFPAAPRTGKPILMKLRNDRPTTEPLTFQELELQYRLRQAGFQGIRIRRFPERSGQSARLLALAVRRACN